MTQKSFFTVHYFFAGEGEDRDVTGSDRTGKNKAGRK